MISDARRGHVSPGIYTEEKDVTYSVKSLGITSLGLVGETLYGPAFENIEIKNWSEFVDYFGGTSTEKFKSSGLPKYELPYIAKSYLEESQRLNVVRVLGLSGYHAGPAWAIKDGENVVAILRSKRVYGDTTNDCGLKVENSDNITTVVSSIAKKDYAEKSATNPCTGTGSDIQGSVSGYVGITVTCNAVEGFNSSYSYDLSFHKGDANYIYNVLSNRPDTGTTPVYVEAVFESSLTSGSLSVSKLTGTTPAVNAYFTVKTTTEGEVTKYTLTYVKEEPTDSTTANTKESTGSFNDGQSVTLTELGLSAWDDNIKYIKAKYTAVNDEPYDDYTDHYLPAVTPYVVSEATVTGSEVKVKRMFRFVTISDGDAANFQVKVSIEKIDPTFGTFDVVVRDFYDTDASPIVLERFVRCNMVEGDAGYVAYRIGTADGGFVAKSKYILVDMWNGEDLRNSVPAGFEGYPMPEYAKGGNVKIAYNKKYDLSIKPKKQYFGISDITGIDADIFSYKGRITTCTTPGFHLDSYVNGSNIYIDGESGYAFESVASGATSANSSYRPRLTTYSGSTFINNSIYKDIKLRKFTVCFYGGFDGWDVHRERRTNINAYNSSVISGAGVFKPFDPINDLNRSVSLSAPTGITSDYYAYLTGYRVFANPQDVDINLFATPGINWKDHTLLTEEAIDMIEDAEDGRGGDALYVMASPADRMADEIADEFESTEINSSYACTYAPWVMYYDASNRKYLNLPVTKDVVRNMAATDNNSYPWFAPAGMERGNVNCVKAEYKTTLANEDELYENRVNPVKTFAQDGVKIWGNKTAYNVESPLNRINVRRLMIRVKKLVTNAAKNLIFTQYDDTLEKQFRGLIDPILAEVKSNRGISDYRIITEVTPETKDQHILPAKILIKPTPALEYISISFVVYPESVSFENE